MIWNAFLLHAVQPPDCLSFWKRKTVSGLGDTGTGYGYGDFIWKMEWWDNCLHTEACNHLGPPPHLIPSTLAARPLFSCSWKCVWPAQQNDHRCSCLGFPGSPYREARSWQMPPMCLEVLVSFWSLTPCPHPLLKLIFMENTHTRKEKQHNEPPCTQAVSIMTNSWVISSLRSPHSFPPLIILKDICNIIFFWVNISVCTFET